MVFEVVDLNINHAVRKGTLSRYCKLIRKFCLYRYIDSYAPNQAFCVTNLCFY